MAGNDKRPIPKSQSELIGLKDDRTINRANEVRRDNDNISNFNIGLYDHDEAISHYFTEIIRPQVVDDGHIINVPILYGSPERWKAVQKGYFHRDQQGQIQVPLIMYKRTGLEKNKDLTTKIDANNPRNFISYENNYTQINKYDKFSILNGIKPQKEFFNIIVPDYVKLTYECIIWTEYVEHMNKIVEAINYAEGSYWGMPERYKFLATIDSFENTSEVAQGQDRQIRSTFTLNLNGYIVPDAIQKDLAKFTGKSYSMSRIKFDTIVNTDKVDSIINPSSGTTKQASSGMLPNQGSSTVTNTIVFKYIAAHIERVASSITSTTATFTAAFLEAPTWAGLASTSIDDFTFLINGQVIGDTVITSFIDTGEGTCVLTLDISILGYSLDSGDTIVAIGKFAS